ncbi:tryptophan synthase subunit alpha [bacterium]|nr:tryptophan synthase subunit alpha [bacterium]
MGRMEKRFSEALGQGRKVFIAYITAGDPSLESTMRLVREFETQGVDIIELGVPFSDPVADGPVNQEAAMRALKSGVNIGQILGMIRELRKESQIPIIFFTYYNSLLAYGLERFVNDAADSGLDGALVLDLPPEEAGEYKHLMDEKHLATVFLVSPVTPEERLEMIAENATGFVYYVSQMGVTGERESIARSIPDKVGAIKARTKVPVAVGFGISTPDHVREIARYADGVIVGSSIVRKIGDLGSRPGFEKEVGAYVGTLASSTYHH